MRSLNIIALCIFSAVIYGILHDQITARVSVEYFTIGHPPVFPTRSPTLLGLGWGIIATWWVGLLLGVPLSIAARAGPRLKRGLRSLVRPIVLLLLVMGFCALLAGVIGYCLGVAEIVTLIEPETTLVPKARHARFLAAIWSHTDLI